MVATDNGQAVTGMLVENLSKKDIEALDVFEGDVSNMTHSNPYL